MFIRCATLCFSAVNHLGALNCFRLCFPFIVPASNSARLAALHLEDHFDNFRIMAFRCPAVRRNLRPTTTSVSSGIIN